VDEGIEPVGLVGYALPTEIRHVYKLAQQSARAVILVYGVYLSYSFDSSIVIIAHLGLNIFEHTMTQVREDHSKLPFHIPPSPLKCELGAT
jgi:hypothetical protein